MERVRTPNLNTNNRFIMDSINTHGLTQRERTELQFKIQRLQWLLNECIGIEEYELCSQIRNLIQRKYELLATNQSENQTE
jgi:protein-arginine kinase activator protein McsA